VHRLLISVNPGFTGTGLCVQELMMAVIALDE
jgi:hypothetical protein